MSKLFEFFQDWRVPSEQYDQWTLLALKHLSVDIHLILHNQHLSLHQQEHIMSALTDLQTATQANTTAIQDLATRISNLPTGTPDSALQSTVDQLNANNAQLATLAPPTA